MTSPIAVELRGLTKVFRTVVANSAVNLRVRRGSIHGVIGENGAGKSTAMKMLYGIYQPDEGTMLIDGVERRWSSPHDAIQAGIGMVHQHFMLAGPYSVLDNILLGAEPGGPSWLPRPLRLMDRAGARKKLQALAEQYSLPVDWDAPIESLPVGVQQRVEILKLLYRDARVLILDEPTAVLTPQETHELFANLRRLRDEGKTILIITHKLREVMEFTDRVTVFRGGKVTGEVHTSETSPQGLADLMVGRKVLLSVDMPAAPVRAPNAVPALELKGVTLRGHAVAGKPARHRLYDLTFDIQPGEIVGIAGVEGNGQSELVRAVLHPSDPACRSAGIVRVLGKDVSTSPTARIKALGVGVIPEDRHREGLLLERPVMENFLLGQQRSSQFGSGTWIRYEPLRRATAQALEEYDVRPRSLDIAAGRLSGGNQQKLIIAREFQRAPKLLIAAQPTRGVDVGAIEFIHKRLIRARQEGAGVLLISSELEEILSLSDRILVMYEGRVAGQFRRGEVTEKELGLRMGGGA